MGGCFVEQDGIRLDGLSAQRKALGLLAVAASAGDAGVSRDTLIGYFWPETTDSRARNSLKQVVHSLREKLSRPELFLDSADVRLNPLCVTSDVAEFRDAARRRDYPAIAERYAGMFLDGFHVRGAPEFERWVDGERMSLHRAYTSALEALATRASTSGDVRGAAEWWRLLATAEPLSQFAASGLVKALTAAGERAAALQHARAYEALVKRELDSRPDSTFIATIRDAEKTSTSINPSQPLSHEKGSSHVVEDDRLSVAVLPFANTSGDIADEYFADGLTEELISALAHAKELRVTGRTSAFAIRGKGLDVRAIADTLGVSNIVEGSVRRDGNQLRIAVQLLSAYDNSVLWGKTYSEEVRDVFVLQETIALAIARALRVELGPSVKRFADSRATDPATYELYLKGRFFLNRGTGDDHARAVEYFRRAIARDANFAKAHAGLADAHLVLAIFSRKPAPDQVALAKLAATAALELDHTLAETHTSLASVLMAFDWDWHEAGREFDRALDADALYTLAHHRYGLYLMYRGRIVEARAVLERAIASDPLSAAVNMNLGRVHVSAGRPDQAMPFLRAAVELSPGLVLAHEQIGHAYLLQGDSASAIAAFRRAAVARGSSDSAGVAYALAATGDQRKAIEIIARLLESAPERPLPPVAMAMAYGALGDPDSAFQWLERAYETRAPFMDGLKVAPGFESLREDSRWPDILRRLGLID